MEMNRGVVFIMPAYLPESFGGAEQQARKLAAALAATGTDVFILAPRLKASTPGFEKDGHITVRRFLLHKLPNLGGRYVLSFLWWSVCVTLWLMANSKRYAAVHIFHGRLHAVPAVWASWLLGKPTLVKIGRGGAQFDLALVKGKFGYGRFFYGMLVKRITAYISNSREISADLASHGISKHKIFEVPNGVELPDENAIRFGRSDRRFIFMGRLEVPKGVDRIIDAFNALPTHYETALVIAGDGPEAARLQEKAKQGARAKDISFTGRVDNVGHWLSSSKFCLSASLSEGMSNALLEAMSYGVIPVVSRVSGVSDVVEHEVNGFLFEPGNDADMAECLRRALDLDDQESVGLARAAHDRMRSAFSIQAVAERHNEIYRMLAAAGPGAGSDFA